MTAHKWGFLLGRAYFIIMGSVLIMLSANLSFPGGIGIAMLAWIVSPRYSDDH
jgi:hypothetical protein